MKDTDPVTIYKQVLTGKRKIFPMNYWNQPDSPKNAAIITRYMIENILRWSDDDVREKLNLEVFRQYRLRGMMAQLFRESTWRAVENAYPGKFRPWELKASSVGEWDKDLRVKAVKWLIEERLKLPPEHRMYVSVEDFDKNGLSGLIAHYGGSPAAAIAEAYPDINPSGKEMHFNIRTTREVKEMLRKIADYHQCTATEWIEKAIRSEYRKITGG